jgi:rod shape-determining protein MreC
MKRKILYRFIFVFILLVVLYLIWPIPFWIVAKRIILPIAEKTRKATTVLYAPVDVLIRIDGLAKENKRLSEENLNLESKLTSVVQEQKLCKEYAAEKLASGTLNQVMITAKVIGRTPQDFNRSLVIDKGSRDGVQEGRAVLSMGYLFGRISNVGESQSDVSLITDHKSLIPAILEKSRETGLVQGGLEGLILTEVPVNSVIEKDERVLTSGLGGDLPSGIIIGQIKDSQKSSSLFQSAKISYPIQSTKIEIVSVIK